MTPSMTSLTCDRDATSHAATKRFDDPASPLTFSSEIEVLFVPPDEGFDSIHGSTLLRHVTIKETTLPTQRTAISTVQGPSRQSKSS